MIEYFKLQFRMANRRIKVFGFNLILGYSIAIIVFYLFSILLFEKIEFAEYVYILLSLNAVGMLSEKRRNEFLKICFPGKMLSEIRILENTLIALPFLLFLIYNQLFLSATILITLSSLLALVNYRTTINFTISTPFYKKPFEFLVGFRNTFYLVLIAYILTCISVSIDNFNLGIFSILLIFSITLSFYSKPENEYYVWLFNLNPKQFLLGKIKTALVYSTLLIAPAAMTMAIFFSQNTISLFLFILAGYSFLTCMITAKYATYPHEVSLIQGTLFAFSIYYPPILVLLVPYLFYQSIRHLKPYLT